MTNFRALTEYAAQGRQIAVGIVGAGQMGEGLACQMELMRGIATCMIADIQPGRAQQALISAGIAKEEIIETTSPTQAAEVLAAGKRVATSDATLLATVEGLDIVVEATGIPVVGAEIARDAILNRRHVLQMNVETDATVGYILRSMAQAAGVVYTLTCGDEPGATAELYDFVVSLGFEPICAGKGKNNPLDRHATPDTVAQRAHQQQMNPKMLASFVDGTKTMVEMTSLANGIGFIPDIRGMHGPAAEPQSISRVFVPQEAGGVISAPGRVEYGIGIAPGVFVVFTAQNPKIVRDLIYVNLGPGPYWALYRPYHLCNLETPISIVRAVLKGDTTLATDSPPTAETISVAKRDLKAGETIDGLGGFSVYGMIETATTAQQRNLLPLGLAPGAILQRDVIQDQPLTYQDINLNEQSVIVQLRRMQDQILTARHSKSK